MGKDIMIHLADDYEDYDGDGEEEEEEVPDDDWDRFNESFNW